jgi:hypothetical protein
MQIFFGSSRNEANRNSFFGKQNFDKHMQELLQQHIV